jgi:hypothetical protein
MSFLCSQMDQETTVTTLTLRRNWNDSTTVTMRARPDILQLELTKERSDESGRRPTNVTRMRATKPVDGHQMVHCGGGNAVSICWVNWR